MSPLSTFLLSRLDDIGSFGGGLGATTHTVIGVGGLKASRTSFQEAAEPTEDWQIPKVEIKFRPSVAQMPDAEIRCKNDAGLCSQE